MTIKEIISKYSWKEIGSMPGDAKFRYEIFSPLFDNLYEYKLVYHERISGIIKLEDIQITPERFEATAVPYLCLERGSRFDEYFFKKKQWKFGATWPFVRLSGNVLCTYGGWLLWTEPDLVKKVEELILKKDFERASTLTVGEK